MKSTKIDIVVIQYYNILNHTPNRKQYISYTRGIDEFSLVVFSKKLWNFIVFW